MLFISESLLFFVFLLKKPIFLRKTNKITNTMKIIQIIGIKTLNNTVSLSFKSLLWYCWIIVGLIVFLVNIVVGFVVVVLEAVLVGVVVWVVVVVGNTVVVVVLVAVVVDVDVVVVIAVVVVVVLVEGNGDPVEIIELVAIE